ncbi:hypothetical protein BJY52DRAFT_177314 [Lactarius psammicola]|nr:hypothetical protein BJY52DRAFT_177314 [Lactarius psammicola]
MRFESKTSKAYLTHSLSILALAQPLFELLIARRTSQNPAILPLDDETETRKNNVAFTYATIKASLPSFAHVHSWRTPPPLPQRRYTMATLPPLVLPPWLSEKDRYHINLPRFDTLLAIADKGRRPRRVKFPIGPVPSGLYKTAQDTINWNVPQAHGAHPVRL